MRKFKWSGLFLAYSTFGFCNIAYANQYKAHCENAGGQVEKMQAQFTTSTGEQLGLKKKFCTFRGDNYFASIGLKTFASKNPNLAATYIQKLKPLRQGSSLFEGTHPNPSTNVCQNLGGTTITHVTSGGFANDLGQSDICVFGDGSMVSGWTLIYIANHREGYDVMRTMIKSDPLNIMIPSQSQNES